MTFFRLFVVVWMTVIALFPIENDVSIADECVKCSTTEGQVCCPS